MSAAWHVALTRPGEGRIAESHLRQQSFQVFNPKVKRVRVVRGREYISESHYIPGYIFVFFDALIDPWYPINWTRGIKKLIAASPVKPIPIADEAMQVMIERCDDEGYVVPQDVDRALEWLRVGKRVRVECMGQFGIIDWKIGDRVGVILSFLGSTRTVEMKVAQLAAA